FIVHSSEGRAHVLWRVEGISVERAEALQKHLARELDTDTAATSAAQMTRLPGFFNYKYTPPQIVVVDDRPERATYGSGHFPDTPTALTTASPRIPHEALRSPRHSLLERAQRYLA